MSLTLPIPYPPSQQDLADFAATVRRKMSEMHRDGLLGPHLAMEENETAVDDEVLLSPQERRDAIMQAVRRHQSVRTALVQVDEEGLKEFISRPIVFADRIIANQPNERFSPEEPTERWKTIFVPLYGAALMSPPASAPQSQKDTYNQRWLPAIISDRNKNGSIRKLCRHLAKMIVRLHDDQTLGPDREAEGGWFDAFMPMDERVRLIVNIAQRDKELLRMFEGASLERLREFVSDPGTWVDYEMDVGEERMEVESALQSEWERDAGDTEEME